MEILKKSINAITAKLLATVEQCGVASGLSSIVRLWHPHDKRDKVVIR